MPGSICSSNIYKFKGWIFEIHRYFGPWPLKKNGEPRKCAGDKFWKVCVEFDKLNEAEKKKCLCHEGGCKPIN